MNRNRFQNYTINENTTNNSDLENSLNGTSNEYDLQSVYTGKNIVGAITELSQVCLTICDTNIQPFTYTGSRNIDITDNQVSLKLPAKINDEIVLHPRNYDGAVFDMLSGTDNLLFDKTQLMEVSR